MRLGSEEGSSVRTSKSKRDKGDSSQRSDKSSSSHRGEKKKKKKSVKLAKQKTTDSVAEESEQDMPSGDAPADSSPDERSGMRKASSLGHAFLLFDADGGGTISLSEFLATIGLGGLLTESQAEMLFDEMDVDQSGVIDRAEFAARWHDIQTQYGVRLSSEQAAFSEAQRFGAEKEAAEFAAMAEAAKAAAAAEAAAAEAAAEAAAAEAATAEAATAEAAAAEEAAAEAAAAEASTATASSDGSPARIHKSASTVGDFFVSTANSLSSEAAVKVAQVKVALQKEHDAFEVLKRETAAKVLTIWGRKVAAKWARIHIEQDRMLASMETLEEIEATRLQGEAELAAITDKAVYKDKKVAIRTASLAAEAEAKAKDAALVKEAAIFTISRVMKDRRALKEAHARESEAKLLLKRQAAARQAAEDEAARAVETANDAVRLAAAAERSAKRVRAFKKLPPTYFELPAQMRVLVENAIFQSHAAEQSVLRAVDLAAAAVFVEKPAELTNIWESHGTIAERTAAIQARVKALPAASQSLIIQLADKASRGEVPVLKLLSSAPEVNLQLTLAELAPFFAAQALCKGCQLPPETAKPWKWREWWAETLNEGEKVGADFERGMLQASASATLAALAIRAEVGGHRPTALRAVGMLLRSVAVLDLRDNRITDEETKLLAIALPHATSLSKLNLAGNVITSIGMARVGTALSTVSPMMELIISRNRLWGDGTTRVEHLTEMAQTITLGGKLQMLQLSGASLNDLGGGKWLAALTQPAQAATSPAATRPAAIRNGRASPGLSISKPDLMGILQLTVLDMSQNGLRSSFASALSGALSACPNLTTLNLSKNNFGAEAGTMVLSAAMESASLRVLDMSATNLCDISPLYPPPPGGRKYTPEAIRTLCRLLPQASLTELHLHQNELCGLFTERIWGGAVIRGTYKSDAIKALADAFEGSSVRLPLKKDGLRLERGNHLMAAEEERLTAALSLNAAKDAAPPKVTAYETVVDVQAATPDPKAPRKDTSDTLNHFKPANAEKLPAPAGGTGATLPTAISGPLLPSKEALDAMAIPNQVSPSLAQSVAPPAVAVSDAAVPSAPADGEHADARSLPADAVAAEVKMAKAKPSAPKAAAKSDAAKPKVEENKQAEVDEDGKPARSGYGQQKKVKKKTEKVEKVVEVNPFANSPLLVAVSPLVARQGPALDTPLVGENNRMAPGTLVRVAQTQEVTRKEGSKSITEKRMLVALDGDVEALGWVTGVDKEGVENLRLAAAGFALVVSTKALVVRETVATDGKKVEDLPPQMLLRVMESQTTADGSEKALVSRDGSTIKAIGWVLVFKEGMPARTLVPAPMLQLSFDLQVHTAQALTRALAIKQAGSQVRKRKDDTLPSQIAGKRPTFKPDDGAASRHTQVKKPATIMLMFNCFNAAFDVTSWTGDVPFEKLSGETAFDLIAKKSRKRVGRVKLANELGMPFLARVEFPDEWVMAEEYGVYNDGWQGLASLEVELTWGKAVAIIIVKPWLAYGASTGARLLIRKLGASSGQCATIQRILGDDRAVARVDGYSKSDGVKGETIVDLQPITMVPTTFPGYARNTRVLLLHANKLVDATVLAWLGGFDYPEGSRHMMNVKALGAETGSHAWHDLNMYNHVCVPDGIHAVSYEGIRQSYCRIITQTEDKVEDAITGNSLFIKDQLIFMNPAVVPDGCLPVQYKTINDVPALVTEQLERSPKRSEGCHTAQPVLCRAGPGTGKTWMIKQCFFLLAERLSDPVSEGIPLVPIIVFVQRIVRLLRELGDDPSALLQDPKGLMRWYIDNQFADRKEERTMLMLAYEMRAVAILVDGVDEAAGMRDIVEAFVHFELVTGGNRLVVTSRPEGVDLDDYKSRFVVMNLLELSQEQQRNVIQMQLQGNDFFEHLVNIAECRKDLDERYNELFRSEATRTETEAFKFEEAEMMERDRRLAKMIDEEKAARAERATRETDEKAPTTKEARAIEEEFARQARWTAIREAVVTNSKVPRDSLTIRRLTVDGQAELQSWLSKVDLKKRPRARFLGTIHSGMLQPSRAGTGLFDDLESELRRLPMPCTATQLEPTVLMLAQGQPAGVKMDPVVRESLAHLGLLRKMPATGGRRGSKAAQIPANGLWFQVIQHTDETYMSMQLLAPTLMHALGTVAARAGVSKFALQQNEKTGLYVPRSAVETPELEYRSPVDLWVQSTTLPGSADQPPGPPAWAAKVKLHCEHAEQFLLVTRLLVAGIEVEMDAEMISLTLLTMRNSFRPEELHPTHYRNLGCHMLLASSQGSVAVLIEVEHTKLLTHYTTLDYAQHYDFFFNRNAENLGHAEFDTKFELLLVFLVEAIGVPVLLSLLLLTYSTGASSKDVVDMNELPDGRLNLYKMGIVAGIRKRMLLNVASEKTKQDGKDAKGAAEVVEDTKDEGAAPQRRERRKGALEQGGGGMSFSAAGPSSGGSENEKTKAPRGGAKDEPVLDLNSILRGKKVRVVTGEDDVAECYSLVVRVLDKTKQPGFDLRSGIVAVVPKSHTMHAPVTALVEYVTQPSSQSEAALMETCKKMLRRVAVDNQENGRREFTSKNVACALGGNPEELGLWSRLDLDHDYGVALCATLAKQSDKAPAQYQFKHLSFQEGLYAEHLLILVTSLAPPAGAGWHGWMSDKTASEFLNNRYMNNTCRIAAGTLGSLLARQRPSWNFRNATLTANGRSALWFITNENETVESINVSQNDVTFEDVPGICKMLTTCPTLKSFDLSDNDLFKMVEVPLAFSRLCDALGNNHIITDLNLNNNRLGMVGVRVVANALRSCGNLKRLGLSFNEPGVDPALANLLRVHTSLETIELVEKNERLFPSRAKDDIGRALIENKKKKLGFLHCDMFVLSETTKSLTWAKEASTSDAVLLAGVLATNTTLTTFNIAPGAILENKARSELGEALLNNPGSRVAFCNDFGLTAGVDVCEFDLSRSELKDVEPFRLLAGCLRGNRTLTHVTLKQLRMEQIATLALALRGNDTLAQLDMVNASRAGGQSVVRLPVPELNGSKTGNDPTRVDLSKTCMEGAIGRVACAMIGTLISSNTLLERLDLSDTGVGIAIGAEGEGGHILLRPICESAICPINEINLTNVQLNDKAGGKLLTALVTGLGEAGSGYDKIKSLLLSRNELGKQFTTGLKTLLWSERAPCVLQRLDLSFNPAIDGYEMGIALKRNESLTSIDFRGVPGANTNDIYSFLGNFFLQEDCNCRVGFLSCDAFQVEPNQDELVLSTSAAKREAAAQAIPLVEGGAATAAPGTTAGPAKASKNNQGTKQNPVILLLAGVIRFNMSLKSLLLTDTGLDDAAAASFATALKDNKTLQHLDLSGNAEIGAAGIRIIAEAIRAHPLLSTTKVDGKPLPIAQLCGSNSTEVSLDFTDWSLGAPSGLMIGAILLSNRQILNLNLKGNQAFGTQGIRAIVEGCVQAPLKVLDATKTGLGGEADDVMRALSVSICRTLGVLSELRLDENDLACGEDALAPLCKLRNLRTLSFEKNRLSSLPSLIGTMLSLRRLLLHSNNLMVLPDSICLLSGLEQLDVHKNMISTLPSAIGKLAGLQKLDISENKLSELPVSICELSETLQLSVGRNPLEKPSVEQARQGVGSIRRFYGWSKSKAGDDAADTLAQMVESAPEEDASWLSVLTHPVKRPVKSEDTPSRHDWSGAGSVIVCFNASGSQIRLVDGGSELGSIAPSDSVELVTLFNLQAIGRVRPARTPSEKPADRLEFYNQWLPWRVQEVSAGEKIRMAVYTRSNALRGSKATPLLVLAPWIAYSCSVGARLKMASGFVTVVDIRPDDTCKILRDNDAADIKETIDPRPDNASRTASASYKPGQKLVLMEQGVLVDAVVEEWLGARRGSRHRLRLSLKGDAVTKAADALVKRLGKKRLPGEKGKMTVEMDLNELNHAKLLFATGTKYEDARTNYLEKFGPKYANITDEATLMQLQVADQRVSVRAKALAALEVAEAPDAAKPGIPPPPSATTENEKVEKVVAIVDPGVSAISLVNGLLANPEAVNSSQKPHVVWARGRTEHDMLQAQVLHMLGTTLRKGEIRLVPLMLLMSRIAEMVQDESKRAPPRDMIIKAVEVDFPNASEMLRQAMELRALVFVAEVRDESDLVGFTPAVLEELLGCRLILVFSGVSPTSKLMPSILLERTKSMEIASIGLFFNDTPLVSRNAKELLRRMQAGVADVNDAKALHYGIISGLHLSASELGRDVLQILQDLLGHSGCNLTRLDLSYTQVDGYPLVQAIKNSKTLTSLDVRFVPRFEDLYENLGEILLQPNRTCRLCYMRCDAFELLEGEKTLSLRERVLDKGAPRLLAGLLQHNTVLQDLDLSATDLDSEGASAIMRVMQVNTVLKTLQLTFNPRLDDECRAALRNLADKWRSGKDQFLTL